MYQACSSICGSGDSGVGAQGLAEAARAMRQALLQAEADLGSLVAKHAAWCDRMACGTPARGKERRDKETAGETEKGEAAADAAGVRLLHDHGVLLDPLKSLVVAARAQLGGAFGRPSPHA